MDEDEFKLEDLQQLPDGHWEFIEKYLPGYYRRDDIAAHDDLTKYVEDEYDYRDPDDFERIQEIRAKYPEPKAELAYWTRQLLIEALQAAIPALEYDMELIQKRYLE